MGMNNVELAGKVFRSAVDYESFVKSTPTTSEVDYLNRTSEELTTELASINASIEEIDEQIESAEKDKAKLLKKIEQAQDEVDRLMDEVKDAVAQAIEEQKEIADDQKSEAKKISNKEIDKYAEACKAASAKGEEPPSRSTLTDSINKALGALSEDTQSALNKCFAEMFAANAMLDEAEMLCDDIRDMSLDIQGIDLEVAGLKSQKADKQAEAAKVTEAKTQVDAQAEAASECTPPPCDPIGFNKGEGEDMVRYDFIIDDDGNNKMEGTDDFLGAKGNFNDMMALDTSGDGKVDVDELEAANIKLVKTDAQGVQSVVDARTEFNDDFSVDLTSYKRAQEGTTFDGMDENFGKDNTGNGVVDQKLLGTFNVNLGDGSEEITGYNTLDDVEYLQQSYAGVTDDGTLDYVDTGAFQTDTGLENLNKTTSNIGFWVNEKKTEIAAEREKIDGVKADLFETDVDTTVIETEIKNRARAEANAIKAEHDAIADKFLEDNKEDPLSAIFEKPEAAETEEPVEEEAPAETTPTYEFRDGKIYTTDENGNEVEVNPNDPNAVNMGTEIEIDGKKYHFDSATGTWVEE